MSLSDCPGCWDTPCTCKDARGYRHLSLNELVDIRDGINALITERRKECGDPDKRHFVDHI